MEEIYELSNLINLTYDINKPLNKTHRIKYTCFDASRNYIVCGATSGSIYLFQRKPCKFLQLIPNIFGAITHVAISPNERYVAFTSQRGTVLVYFIDLTSVQPLVVTAYFREMTIAQLKWKENETQLFAGDLKGNVFLVNLKNFLGRNLRNISIHPILFLESPVVQICNLEHLLLVSNYTKCILCNTENEEFKQIGNQPRDGAFGACFLGNSLPQDTQLARIYCARPGSRIWECTLDGSVLQTHKFKSALKTFRCNNILSERKHEPDNALKSKEFDHLLHLQPILNRFILGYTNNSFYVFDLIQSNVVLWNDEFDKIQTIKVIENDDNNTIVVFTKDSKIFMFQLHQLDQYFAELLKEECIMNAGRLLLDHLEYFKEKALNSEFSFYYSIFLTKLEHEDSQNTLMEDVKFHFDSLVTNSEQNNAITNDIIKLKEMANIKLENKVFVIENNVFDLKEEHQITLKRVNDYAIDDNSHYDDEIVVKHEQIKSTQPILKIELLQLSEHEKIVQNLFLIFKSLKMTNLNLVERYSDIFDRYDLPGVQRLLTKLETMIVENDRDVNDVEAKKHCARMYLNYFDSNLIYELDEKSLDFIIDCFVLVNTYQSVDKPMQQCLNCIFPLVVEMNMLKYKPIANALIKLFWPSNKKNKCFEIITKVPAVLNIALEMIIAHEFGSISKSRQSMKMMNDTDKDTIVDFLFSCANKLQLEQCVENYPWFQTLEFWNKFFDRLIPLRANGEIKCIQCGQLNKINSNQFGSSKSFFTFDWVLNICADYMNGLTALRLCTKYAVDIPCDAINKSFYLKCLLHT